MRNSLLVLLAILCRAALCSAQATHPQIAPVPLPSDVHLDASLAASDYQGSTYVPLDNWVYPALDRLQALGYLDSAFLGLKPWTRTSIARMLELSADSIESDSNNDEARSIYIALVRELKPDIDRSMGEAAPKAMLESVYTQFRGIGGPPLRDSFHLGATIVNDYGRPYEQGFNNYTGFSARAWAGRFSLYFRSESQYSPASAGYSPSLSAYLSSCIDNIPLSAFSNTPPGPTCINGIPAGPSQPQDTIPEGPLAATRNVRLVEAVLSYHLLGHEISFGKGDHWLGPATGASMLWGNNAENIYDFEINRVEPLRIPGLSRLTGPFRYDFFVGSLKGHTYPNDPWVHMEKISFKPTRNLEFGFDRLSVWGGKNHVPITIHSFLHSFFSFQNVSVAEKNSRNDPGYRIGTFDFTYRLPFLRHWITLYTDSVVHDDVNPISAPARAGFRPGIYLARFPDLEHLDLRLEGAYTETVSHANPDSSLINNGQFLYWENVQRQGPTNNGSLVGDWVGRQGKGGQAWLTYHVTPQEMIQFQFRLAKASAAFIPGGTSQNDFAFNVVKRVHKDIELRGWVQFEHWQAPIYKTGLQSDNSATFQVTWFPPEPAN